ncbi:hypothetical protein VE02_00206 [Pseudogymnoascus sp. 03VT05]|nr:hypothetical protein VE02_00206 [Pseudogymnoascus sp. 03VT05]
MSTPISIPRTAPIPIAAKPNHAKNDTPAKESIKPKASSSMRSLIVDGDLPNTRTRKDRPCDACRRRKSKCVIHEGQVACVLCKFHKQDCTFVQSPQPRKRKLVPEEGKEGKEDSAAKRRSPDRPEEPSKRRQPESSNSSTCAGSLTEDMANIGGPAMLKRTLGLQNDRYSQYIGPTTDFEPSLLDLSHFDPQDESLLSRGTLRKVSDVDTFLMLPDYNTPGYEHVIEDSDAVEAIVTPHGPALIDLYFHVIHPSFPIIQKTVFLEKYARSYQEFSPALLAAMYILAINWWDHSEQLAKSPRPNVRELERLVRTSLADAMYRPKLSTIQAGLLLSQRPEGDQWAPTAQLVAIGQELGLHLDCSNWKIPLWERGLRKRLAWALYMQDKWGSLIHGRPSHIFASNWAVRSLTWNDFPDDQSDPGDDNDREDGEVLEHERGRLLFTEMVSLSQLLAEVLETFYTLAAMDNVTRAGTSGTHMVLSLAKPVQLKLKEWFAALPVCLKMENSHTNLASSPSTLTSGSQGSRLSSTGFLHLSYFATEITLHRRIVRSLTPAGPNLPPIDPYILHICRSAAKTRLISAMDFVNRLTPSHLRAFWYFSSKTNFALIGTFGSLLWATAPGKEEADFYRMRLKEYRWTLGVSARAGVGADGEGRGVKGLTEFALGMLDTSTGLLKALPEKPLLSRDNSEVGLGSSHSASLISLGGMMSSSARSGGGGYGFGFGMSDGQAGSGDVDSGLASPSDSTSSVEVSQGFEAFMAAHPQGRDSGGR